jgi:hypothetical protein
VYIARLDQFRTKVLRCVAIGSLVAGLVGGAIVYGLCAPIFTGPDSDLIRIYVVDSTVCGLILGALVAGGLAYLYRHTLGTHGPHHCWGCRYDWSP